MNSRLPDGMQCRRHSAKQPLSEARRRAVYNRAYGSGPSELRALRVPFKDASEDIQEEHSALNSAQRQNHDIASARESEMQSAVQKSLLCSTSWPVASQRCIPGTLVEGSQVGLGSLIDKLSEETPTMRTSHYPSYTSRFLRRSSPNGKP